MIVDATGRETSSEVTPITERQQARIMAQNATIGEANQIAAEHAAAAMNHLGNQLPAFIHSIVKSAILGYHQSLQEQGIIPKDAPIGEWVEPDAPADHEHHPDVTTDDHEETTPSPVDAGPVEWT